MTGANLIASRNLLFGVLAMQMDFISREDLIVATSEWVADKSKQLDEILLERGVLSQDAHAVLLPVVETHLEKHDLNLEKSLASLGGLTGTFRDELLSLADADVNASLAHIPMSNAQTDATLSWNITTSTSDGRFRVLRPHAKGGLGEVSVALDLELNREVALKRIQRRYARSQQSQARFIQEAEITGILEHPGIVPVYSLGKYADGTPFYAMRFIQGDSLREAVAEFHEKDGLHGNPVALHKILKCFIDVCHTIHYAHSRGVVHRDLKPSNVMIGKFGETLVVDWGLAKPVGKEHTFVGLSDDTTVQPTTSADVEATALGQVVGTPAYMSPEQAHGHFGCVNVASDVYGLGATIYTILTGNSPFEGSTPEETLAKVRKGDVLSPRTANRKTPRPLEAICLKAMARSPNDRYKNALELADDVENWLAREPVSAYRENLLKRLLRRLGLYQRPLASAFVFFVVILDVAILLSLAPMVLVTAGDSRAAMMMFGLIGVALTIVLIQVGAFGGTIIGFPISYLIHVWSGKPFSFGSLRKTAVTGACLATIPALMYAAIYGAQLIFVAQTPDLFELNDVEKAAAAYNDLAWIQATGPVNLRVGQEAVRNATKACKLNPDEFTYTDTLAAAYAEVEDFEAAVEHQEKALAQYKLFFDDDAMPAERLKMEQRLTQYQNRLRSK